MRKDLKPQTLILRGSALLLLLAMLVTRNSALSSDPELARFEETQPHMGTLARIVLYAPDRDGAAAAFRAAFGRI